jgi:hypothetical protein
VTDRVGDESRSYGKKPRRSMDDPVVPAMWPTIF